MSNYWNFESAAEHLGVSKSWLYARIQEARRGGPPGPPVIKIAGRNFIPKKELDEWVRSYGKPDAA